MAQEWRIVTQTWLDAGEDDNEIISSGVDYETFPHDLPFTPDDWNFGYGDLEEAEYDESGKLVMAMYSRFDTEFDRSKEESYPVIVQTMVEFVPEMGG